MNVMQTSITTTSSKVQADRRPANLSTTPVNKRSRISLRKRDHQSPQNSTASSDGIKHVSPAQSPVFPGTPTHLRARTSFRSPLNNSTSSTPSRNWLGSQEPSRDIVWDNTSPVNARGSKGLQKGVMNIRDLCSNLGAGRSCKDECLSQKSGLSDKWLSIGNNLQPGEVPTCARLQNSKETALNTESNFEKQDKCQRGGRTSKVLESLLNSLRKPKQKGALNFDDTASEDSAEDEIQILAHNSDPITKGGSSADDLWGEDEEDTSFLLKASQSVDLFNDTSTKRKSDLVIPSTLSDENFTGNSTSSTEQTSKNTIMTSHRNVRNNPANKNVVFKVPSVHTSSSSTSTGSTSAVNTRSSVLQNSACNPKNVAGENKTFADRIASSNNFDRGTVFKGQAGTNVQSPTAASALSKVVKQVTNEYKRPHQSGHVQNRQFQGSTSGLKRLDEIDVFTLDDVEIQTNPGQVGMPGIWMSQASPANHEARVKNHTPKSPSEGNQSNKITIFTKLLDKKSDKLDEHKSRLIGLGITSRSKSFDVPKCAPSVGGSQVEDDDDIWGDWDADVCSPDVLQLLDLPIESEQKLPKESLLGNSSGQLRSKHNQTKSVLTEIVLRNSNPCETKGGTPLQHQMSGNTQFSATNSSQTDNSYKKQCSRVEINRKKAEALRKRRLREEAQNRSNIASRGLWRTNSMV